MMKAKTFLLSTLIGAILCFSSCFSPARFRIDMQRESMEPEGPIHVGDSVVFSYEITDEALLGHETDELHFDFNLGGEDTDPESFTMSLLKGTDCLDPSHQGRYLMAHENGTWIMTITALANSAGDFVFNYGVYEVFEGPGGTIWTLTIGKGDGYHELTVLE